MVVTGIGFISSIGNSISEVEKSLREMRHGFDVFPANEGEHCPPKLYGSIKEFVTVGWDPEDWTFPDRFKIARSHLKSMSAHVLYAHCSTLDAIKDAGLEPDEISNRRTGLYTASGGSAGAMYHQMGVLNSRGPLRCSPFSVVSSAVGTLNFNLGASFKIKGGICGTASACASSAHSMGFAWEAIASGRQDRMFVIGAEDSTRETILPFAAMRALSTSADPALASCPFDAKRTGFVGSGGAVSLVLESEDAAKARGAKVYAEFAGWGEAGDGHSPAMSHPQGEGLVAGMENALLSAEVSAQEIDYINAHATSTPVGDLSEIRALKTLFLKDGGTSPMVSSTKALTGHPLSMAGALEAGISCLAIKNGFIPGSAHIDTLDSECAGLNIVQKTEATSPSVVLSNSSGFGGANVSLIFKKWAS